MLVIKLVEEKVDEIRNAIKENVDNHIDPVHLNSEWLLQIDYLLNS